MGGSKQACVHDQQHERGTRAAVERIEECRDIDRFIRIMLRIKIAGPVFGSGRDAALRFLSERQKHTPAGRAHSQTQQAHNLAASIMVNPTIGQQQERVNLPRISKGHSQSTSGLRFISTPSTKSGYFHSE
jgi:hypothetical protein